MTTPLEAHLQAAGDARLTPDGERQFRESVRAPAARAPSDWPTQIERDVDRILGAGVTLAGRTFRALGVTTFEHDAFMMQALTEANLLSTLQRFDPARQELGDATAAIIVQCFRTGKLFDLLGGVLVEDGTTWTPQTAATAARFFAGLTDPADKDALEAVIPFVLLRFFLRAGASWKASLRYSTSSDARARGEWAPASDRSGATRRDASSAAPSTSANGTSSSDRSPASTSTATAPLPAGRSEKG